MFSPNIAALLMATLLDLLYPIETLLCCIILKISILGISFLGNDYRLSIH
jgi:hypothetical protein